MRASVLFEAGGGVVEAMLFGVETHAGGADGKKAFETFAEVSDELVRMVGTRLLEVEVEGG